MIASMFKDDNENVPPNVANADNVTADEVVDQISFTMKLNVKKFLAGQQIPNYEIAKAEAEKIKVYLIIYLFIYREQIITMLVQM
jgi:hypothetical protein